MRRRRNGEEGPSWRGALSGNDNAAPSAPTLLKDLELEHGVFITCEEHSNRKEPALRLLFTVWMSTLHEDTRATNNVRSGEEPPVTRSQT